MTVTSVVPAILWCEALSLTLNVNIWKLDLIIRATKLCVLAAHDSGAMIFKVTGHSVTGYRCLSWVFGDERGLLAFEYTKSMCNLFQARLHHFEMSHWHFCPAPAYWQN